MAKKALTIKPGNNKGTSGELPTVVADSAGNECLVVNQYMESLSKRGSIAHGHRFVSAASLRLAVSAFSLRRTSVEGILSGVGQQTCLQRPHWKASVSACCSAAPIELNRLSSAIFRFAACRSPEAIS